MKTITRAAALAAMVACAQANALDKAEMKYDATVYDSAPVKLAGACTVNVMSVRDQRMNTETIGNEFTPIAADNVASWASTALDSLSAFGYKVIRHPAPQANAVNVGIDLHRAYTFHGPMRINGVVAFDLGVADGAGAVRTVKLRHLGSKSNMAGMTSEYVTALNYAVNGLVGKLARALEKECPRVSAAR